jgi:hypothetical protein
MSRKLLDFVRSRTENGIFLRIRSLFLYVGFFVVNFPVSAARNKSSRNLNKLKNSTVVIVSIYRPIFWFGNLFEAQFNKILKRRGRDSVHILCDGILDVCDSQFVKVNKNTNPLICSDCRMRNKVFYKKNNINTIALDQFVSLSDLEASFKSIDKISSLEQAIEFRYKDIDLGKLSRLSVCRYWLRLTLDHRHVSTYKKFLKSGVILHEALGNILREGKVADALIFNGRYVTSRIPLEVCNSQGVSFSTYEVSEQQRVLFSKEEIGVTWSDVDRRFNNWLKQQTVADYSHEVKELIEERLSKHVKTYTTFDEEEVDTYDLAVFTNLVWDSAAFERETIFDSQYSWIKLLINWGINNPEFKIAIRIHPAETNVVYNKTEETMSEFIQNSFKKLPDNIKVILPNSTENSYSMVNKSKAVAVYTSSIGLESAIVGKPVISAADTHYSLKGITLSAGSIEEYFSMVEGLLTGSLKWKPDKDLVDKYVYWFYTIYHHLGNTDISGRGYVTHIDSRHIKAPKLIKHKDFGEFERIVDKFLSNKDNHL